jgi:hypothetical protein
MDLGYFHHTTIAGTLIYTISCVQAIRSGESCLTEAPYQSLHALASSPASLLPEFPCSGCRDGPGDGDDVPSLPHDYFALLSETEVFGYGDRSVR